MWPIAMSWVIAYLYPDKTWLLLLLIIISEFFSWVTPGIMTAVILLPFILLYIHKLPEINISFSFLLLIAGLVFVQIILLTMWVTWPIPWQNIPILPILLATAGTSLISAIAVIISDS